MSCFCSDIDALYSPVTPCGHICPLTMPDSGPAWSSRSSRSSPIMSASKSWLVSSIGQGFAVLQPFTNVRAGRVADVGTDTGRETDSKPGGSDGVTDEIMLLGGSSSTTASFRGECTATGAWMGAGTEANALLSWVNWGTSKTQIRWVTFNPAVLWLSNQSCITYYTYQFLYLQLKMSHGKTENKRISLKNVFLGRVKIQILDCNGECYVAYLFTRCILIIWSSQNIQGRLLKGENTQLIWFNYDFMFLVSRTALHWCLKTVKTMNLSTNPNLLWH